MCGSAWESPLINEVCQKVFCEMDNEIDPFNKAAHNVSKYVKVVGICALAATSVYVVNKIKKD